MSVKITKTKKLGMEIYQVVVRDEHGNVTTHTAMSEHGIRTILLRKYGNKK